ncbi:hypothetical protein D1007_18867 [Hordeum vulgare]|nr:hypothetical protein D1007_18867 [Hordeum vulgare]
MRFDCLGDWDTVTQGGPWHFEGNPVLIAPYDRFAKPSSIELFTFEVWDRIIDLPPVYNGRVKAPTSKLGKFMDVEPLSFDFEGNFFRVRVRLDVRNPVKKAISLIKKGERKIFATRLVDLGYKGRMWTYEKHVAGDTFTRVRMDRTLARTNWCTQFPSTIVEHLSSASPYHSPVLLQLAPRETEGKNAKRFQYEVMWDNHDELKPTVRSAWESRGHTFLPTQVEIKLDGLANNWATGLEWRYSARACLLFDYEALFYVDSCASTTPTGKACVHAAAFAAAVASVAIPGRPAPTRKDKAVECKKAGARATTPTPPLIARGRATPRMHADSDATTASNVFDKMGARGDLHNATAKIVHLLDDNTIDIDQASTSE